MTSQMVETHRIELFIKKPTNNKFSLQFLSLWWRQQWRRKNLMEKKKLRVFWFKKFYGKLVIKLWGSLRKSWGTSSNSLSRWVHDQTKGNSKCAPQLTLWAPHPIVKWWAPQGKRVLTKSSVRAHLEFSTKLRDMDTGP